MEQYRRVERLHGNRQQEVVTDELRFRRRVEAPGLQPPATDTDGIGADKCWTQKRAGESGDREVATLFLGPGLTMSHPPARGTHGTEALAQTPCRTGQRSWVATRCPRNIRLLVHAHQSRLRPKYVRLRLTMARGFRHGRRESVWTGLGQHTRRHGQSCGVRLHWWRLLGAASRIGDVGSPEVLDQHQVRTVVHASRG